MGEIREKIIHDARSAGRVEKENIARSLDYMLLEALIETEEFSLLVMGRPDSLGCYCPVNALLRDGIKTVARHFDIIIIDGVAKIPAHDRVYHRGSVILDLTGGNTDLFLNWLNDEYEEGEYDTNIQIKQIALRRIGRSERSAFAAYLLGTSQGNRVLILGSLVLLMMIIGTLFLLNRKRATVGV